MNQIITDNRQKIASHCTRCFYALEKYNNAVNVFNQERRRIDPLPYIQEEKERMVNKAAEQLQATANAQYEEIKSSLDTIKAAAVEMEDLLDIGEDFQNAISVVKTLGERLPVEACGALVERFRGQKKALAILKAAYEKAGIDAEYYFKGLIFDAAARVDGLDELAYRIAIQPGDNMLVAANFARELEAFAAAMGVELPKRFNEIVDLSAVYAAQIQAAAGLGAND